jgi:hypothetical protein
MTKMMMRHLLRLAVSSRGETTAKTTAQHNNASYSSECATQEQTAYKQLSIQRVAPTAV